tara:strand:+ start:3266 stop:5056 length:1791 start_codon:yes stop_codon:yes gene_type:complete
MSKARDIADSAATINALDGVTATGTELNILDGVTSTTAELNILDGVTSTAAELNILDGVTSNATELNILDAVSRGSLVYGNSSAATALLTKGAADTVLTSDGTDISWQAPAPAGNVQTFTASGAVASGKPVILNTNGTVTQVAESTITEALGTEATFESAATEYVASVFDSNANKTVVFYQGSSSYAYARVVTIASDGGLTFGTEVTLTAYNTSYCCCSFDSTANKVLFVCANHDGKVRARVGTISGTDISFGSEADIFNSGGNTYLKVEYSPDDDRHFVVFKDSSNYLRGAILQISGTNVSNVNGTNGALSMRADGGSQGSSQKADICYDTSADVFVVAFADLNNNNYGTVVTADISSNSATISSKVVFESATSYECVIEYSAANNKFIVGYKDGGNSSYPTARVGSVSGTTASFAGSAQVASSTNSEHYSSTYDTTADRFILLFRNEDVDGGNYAVGTLSGDSISFATPVAFNSGQTTEIGASFDGSAEKVFIGYRDHGNSNYGNARALTTGHVSTNLTSSNWVGVANAAISDGSTGNVTVNGGLITNSGFGLTLTIGSTYFVQRDGTYATSASTPSVTAGKALTATTLVLKGV